jgi:hypothetical protein
MMAGQGAVPAPPLRRYVAASEYWTPCTATTCPDVVPMDSDSVLEETGPLKVHAHIGEAVV